MQMFCHASAKPLKKKIEDAKKIHGDKLTAMEQLKAKLAEQFRLILENRIALSSAKQALDVATVPLADLKKEIDGCHRVVSGDLAALRCDTLETSAAEVISSKLMLLASHLGIEETLATSLPVACTKKQADRGPFDTMVLEQFEKEVISKAANLESQVLTQTAGVTTLEKAFAASQKQLDETTSAHHVASDALNAAIADEKQTSAAYSDCQAELAAFDPTFKAATETVEEKQVTLSNFQTWNVASFDMLKAKPGKPPVAMEEANPEDVPQQASV